MTKVIIYSRKVCPYCDMAKELFAALGVSFEEIEVNSEEIIRQMVFLSNGARSVPQIFINEQHIGGYDNLKELHDKGKLLPMFPPTIRGIE